MNHPAGPSMNHVGRQIASAGLLAGKVALVTGASGGIGQAIARRLASDGAAVVVHYNSRREPADALVAELIAGGGNATATSADLSLSDAVSGLFGFAAQQFGGVDIVVANAGVSSPQMPVAHITDEAFERVLAGNTRATLCFAKQPAARPRVAGSS